MSFSTILNFYSGSGRFETGENIFMSSSSDPNSELNIKSALRSWFNEHKDYTTFEAINASHFDGSKKQIGHYTQVSSDYYSL